MTSSLSCYQAKICKGEQFNGEIRNPICWECNETHDQAAILCQSLCKLFNYYSDKPSGEIKRQTQRKFKNFHVLINSANRKCDIVCDFPNQIIKKNAFSCISRILPISRKLQKIIIFLNWSNLLLIIIDILCKFIFPFRMPSGERWPILSYILL